MLLQVVFRAFLQFGQFGRCDAVCRAAEGRAAAVFDFDKQQGAALLGNQVDFPERAVPVAGDDAAALLFQKMCGGIFRRLSARVVQAHGVSVVGAGGLPQVRRIIRGYSADVNTSVCRAVLLECGFYRFAGRLKMRLDSVEAPLSDGLF